MVSQLVARGRRRCKMLGAQEPAVIVVPYTRAQFTELLSTDEHTQIAFSCYFGTIAYHLPKDPRIQGSFTLPLHPQSILSAQPLDALTVFADGNPTRGAISWFEDGQWQYKITPPQASPQKSELAAAVLAIDLFQRRPINLILDSLYVTNVVQQIEFAYVSPGVPPPLLELFLAL